MLNPYGQRKTATVHRNIWAGSGLVKVLVTGVAALDDISSTECQQ